MNDFKKTGIYQYISYTGLAHTWALRQGELILKFW